MRLQEVRQGFIDAGIPKPLVDVLLDSYVEARRRYYLGDHRPQEVEGGRFSEATFRILQHLCGRPVTPLGTSLSPVDQLVRQFENQTGQPDSVRLHIPRTLRLIYDIRNKRDVAHLSDGIDPNLQDASLVVSNMAWVLAELVRLHHGVSSNEAQHIIEDLVSKEVPAVQEIEGQPVILADLKPRDQALLMLYRAGTEGMSVDELADALRVARKDHLKARLNRLDKERLLLAHPRSGRFYITNKGVRDVESRQLADPI